MAVWQDKRSAAPPLPVGWRPAPFRTFVVKIHSRCNLRCDYCYMFASADQSWRSRPHVMSRATIDMLAMRIAEHAVTHDIDDIDIVLHGGEPLLAGPEIIAYFVSAVRGALDGRNARFSVQTNGLLLDEQFLELFEELGVTVGLSIDGYAGMHNLHRHRPGGGGSYEMAAAAAALISARPGLFGGILAVIDPRGDPVRAYESLLAFSPPVIDLLLPHGTWSAPPPRRLARDLGTPYGDWLIEVFDRWYPAVAKETSIRLFEEIISLLLGGSSRTEEIGLSPVTVVTIESDGAIEESDLLKVAYPRAGATGLHLARDQFDSVLLTPGTAARQRGFQALAARCKACPVARVCGGGLYAHRYRAGHGFDNPSVYCPDLYRLITHIRGRVVADLGVLNRGSG